MSKKIWKAILVLALIATVTAGINVLMLSREYQAGRNEYESLEQYAEIVSEAPTDVQENEVSEESMIPVRFEINFERLKEINGDLAGWIYYEPLEINYPVVRGDDNDYYTSYTFEKEKNSSGAIFMDCLDNPDMSGYNTIIYGHNMKNGTMFGSLKKLLNDITIIEENPYFYIYTQEEAFMYEIASIYITNASSGTYSLVWDEEGQQKYIEYIKGVSQYYWKKEIVPQDKIVTLSTCYGLHSKSRTIVHGVLAARENR